MLNNRQTLAQKMKEVKAIEDQLKQITQKLELLDSQKNLSKNIVDAEGFPRADLNFGDLAQYKNLKRRFNQLNNDHLKLMKEVENGLLNMHAQFKNDPSVEEEANRYAQIKAKEATKNIEKGQQKPIILQKEPLKEYKIQYLTPFAKISSVDQGSPAEKAGLKAGDLISQIGSITVYQPDNIKSIPRVVKQGLPLKIVVMREAPKDTQSKIFNVRGQQRIRVDLQLTPKKWDGRGLIGCKIDPL